MVLVGSDQPIAVVGVERLQLVEDEALAVADYADYTEVTGKYTQWAMPVGDYGSRIETTAKHIQCSVAVDSCAAGTAARKD